MQDNNGVDNVTIMSLNQMCDLALGAVHPGIIHFDLLHQILRAIIQQCNLIDVKMKLQGDKSLEMQKFTSPQKTSLVAIPHPGLSNTSIPKSGEQVTSVRKSEADLIPINSKSKERNILDVESENAKKTGSTKDTNVIILDQLTNKPLEHTVSITVEQMQWIIDSIDSLQNQINEMKQLPSNQNILDSLREGNLSKSSSITKANQKSTESSGTPHKPVARSLSDTPIVDMLQILTLTKRVDAAEESVTKLASLVEEIARDFALGSTDQLLDIESLSELQGMSIASLGNRQALELLTKEVKALKHLIYGEGEDLGSAGANLQTKVTLVEVKMKQVMDQVDNLDRSTSEQVANLFGQCSGLEDTMSRLETKLLDAVIGQKGPLMSLNDRYNKLDEQIDQMRLDHRKVLDANSKREMQMSSLIEQLEVLKTSKVNREEFEDALDRKLDAERIFTKVSQEKFDKTYDDLKMNLEETIMKLTTQEEMWQKALAELQGELVTKLEKNELVALQEFVKGKLKLLKERVKSMKMYQTEKEAAATKQMLLKNVKCLSCDADVATRVKQLPQDYPKSPTLPPSKTIAPYLAYELDVMRKQQRGLTHSRNLHHFEASLRNKGQRVENRYCGGPHTVTTPVQRVTRLGHFLEQWGPEIAPANENFVKGTDQKFYVGSSAETKSNRRQSMTVEGNILRERKGIHEDITNIPEKDLEDLRQVFDKRTGTASNTADFGKSTTRTTTKTSSSRKSLDSPVQHIRDKISAFSFDDDQDAFPFL